MDKEIGIKMVAVFCLFLSVIFSFFTAYFLGEIYLIMLLVVLWVVLFFLVLLLYLRIQHNIDGKFRDFKWKER